MSEEMTELQIRAMAMDFATRSGVGPGQFMDKVQEIYEFLTKKPEEQK